MNTELKVINDFTKSFDISVSLEDYNKQYDKSMKRLSKNVSVPGFRKGKVPATIIKRQYHESVHGDTLDKLIQKYFEQACEETKLFPLGNIKVDKLDFNESKGFDFSISFEVRPELKDLKTTGIEIEKEVRHATDKDLETALENLQMQMSKAKELDDDAVINEGSFVTVDSQQCNDDESEIEGKLYRNMRIKIGEGSFDNKVEKQLEGLKVGDTKFIEKKYPKNSKNKELAGTSEYFKFTVNAIEEREIPELNDDFAKSLNEDGIDTFEQLKTRIKDNLTARFNQESFERFMANCAQALVEANEFELPGSMVDNYLDRLYEQQSQQRQISEERFKTARRDSAIFEIKWQLLKDEIATANNLNVDLHTEEGKADIKAFINELPLPDDQKEALSNNHNYMHEVEYQVLDRKILTFIEENNTIKENEIKPE